jgi:hypothetical protein
MLQKFYRRVSMRGFIFPIIKKQKEDKDKEDKRIPLYKEYSDVEYPIKKNPVKSTENSPEIDFNIDKQFEINNEIRL